MASLRGSIVTLPLASRAAGETTVFVRRAAAGVDLVRFEAIEFCATRTVHPLSATWPTGSFSCERAEYRDGELRFYEGDKAFGFAFDPASGVTVSSGDVERSAFADSVSHDTLAVLAGAHALAAEHFDAADDIVPPAMPHAAAPTFESLQALAPEPWSPSPALGAIFALLGVGVFYAAFKFVHDIPWLTYTVACCGALVLVYGLLVIFVSLDRAHRERAALLDPQLRGPGSWSHAVFLVVGFASIVLGMVVAAGAVPTKFGDAALDGLAFMVLGAALVGFNAAQLAGSRQ